MTLAVLLHPVSEIPEAPVLALLDRTAVVGDDLGEIVGKAIDLSGGYILPRDEHAFVKRHPNTPFGYSRPVVPYPKKRPRPEYSRPSPQTDEAGQEQRQIDRKN